MLNDIQRTMKVLFKNQVFQRTMSTTFETQLSELMLHIIRQLVRKCEHLYVDVLRQSLSYFFNGELLQNLIKEGEYYSSPDKHSELTMDVIQLSHYLQNQFCDSDIHMEALYFLAGIVEYLIVEIMDLSHMQCLKMFEKQIMFSHLQRAIYFDTELLRMSKQFRIEFLSTDDDMLEFKETQKLLKMMNVKSNKKTEWYIHSYLETFAKKVLTQTRDMCKHFQKERIDAQDIEFVFRQI